NAYGMALQGHGIIWSPFILACKDVELGNIIPLFDGQFGLDLPFYAIYRSRRNQPAKIRCFIEMLKTSFEQINQDNYSKFAYPYTLSDIDERR
ncbi:MAG: LysR substrate-binding domain-containing protein, partial [Plesiomonas sp.]